jgi:hypothetical protein
VYDETERLALKVLKRDKEALRRMAAVEGEAMSVVVRRLIRKAAHERGLLSIQEVKSATDGNQAVSV